MRVVYFGTAEFAVPALRAVSEHICLVVSQPDRPSGRGMKLKPSPVKAAALELGLPIETPHRAREILAHVQGLQADFLLVAAYGQILSESLLSSARQGGIDLHGSILPKYRGAAPIQRAIEHGETETGITLMQMDKGMDTGDIIAIERTAIGPDETYGELQSRLAELAAGMAASWLGRLASGDYLRVPQDHGHATLAPKIERAETQLVPSEPVLAAYRRFRAFTPNPGAWLQTRSGRLKIVEARLGSETGELGSVLAGPSIAFRDGSLIPLTVQPEGKPRMAFAEYLNGARLHVGGSLCP